ncbi:MULTISPECIES: plasmid mobilization protein [Pseudoalteromonas]|uniref:plasmid mobilization protein n=1 Tax=Pseudoalteromonas TaxID=53246 RepID=UPI001EF60904|nr:conjugal transfer protein TraJ [Pseudoalteromonas sp. Of11M-6]MCG7556061.1 conjugal transfer protein TraJ [Pseudoalteromonas sp. Of11M-6]
MPRRAGETPINVYVSADEKLDITNRAKAHNLSASAYLKRIGLGYPITTTLDHQAVADLAKLNADQGRLGGLLKLWLTNDEKLSMYDKDKLPKTIEELLQKIYSIQEVLYDKVSKL